MSESIKCQCGHGVRLHVARNFKRGPCGFLGCKCPGFVEDSESKPATDKLKKEEAMEEIMQVVDDKIGWWNISRFRRAAGEELKAIIDRIQPDNSENIEKVIEIVTRMALDKNNEDLGQHRDFAEILSLLKGKEEKE